MKNIFYLIETQSILEKFAKSFVKINCNYKSFFSFNELEKGHDILIVEDNCFDKIKDIAFDSNEKQIVLIIQKNNYSKIMPQKNLIIDFINYKETNENITKRIEFNLDLAKIFSSINSKKNKPSQISPELLKLEIERKKTLLEITDKIAKELTQPLTTLICNAEVLKSEGKDYPKILKKAERIIESGQRITENIKKIQSLNYEESAFEYQLHKNCTNIKILCIIKDKAIIKKIRIYLKNSPETEIFEAVSFESAKQKLKEKYFDLVFTEEFIDSLSIFNVLENINLNYRPFIIILLEKRKKICSYGDYKNIPFEYMQKDKIKRTSLQRIIFRTKEKSRLEKKLLETKSRLTKLPMRDELTGLYKKKWFFEIIPKEISRAKRYKTDLSVLMAEVVDFSQIRDKSGHIFLEKILSQISEVLLEDSRKSDYCCRYNNNFAIVLTNTPFEGAQVFSSRINKNLKNKSLLQNENIKLKWTIPEFNQISVSDCDNIFAQTFS
ncbi:MAG: GGDEF domain-containing protein [Desulforegulaceae bacterium]|nr:GGDEF domain-containing protein [Desulforegulaceae bacterium]